MKNLIFLLLCAISFAGCEKKELTYVSWYVKNSTGETLTIVPPPFSYAHWRLDNGSSNYLITAYQHEDEAPVDFEYFISEGWRTWPPENISFEVRRFSDNKVLRIWNYTSKDLIGKQFFNPSSWTYSEHNGEEGIADIEVRWTFEILPGDIQ